MCWNAQAWSTSGQFWQTPGLRLHVGSMSRCGAVGTSFVARPQQNAAAAAAPGIPTRSSRSCHLRRDCNAQACRSSFASASVVTVGWNDDAAQQGTESQCFLFPLAFECLGLAPGFGATPGVLFGYFLWFFLYFLWFSVRQTRESVSWLTADRAVSQSESQPSGQSVSQSVSQPSGQSVSQSVGQRAAVSQSVSQSVSRPAAVVQRQR